MTTQDSFVTGGADKEALAGMLNSYAPEQLIQEVLTAWDDLSVINQEVAGLRQQNRVLELDLKEREDLGAPDRARLIRLEEDIRDREAKIIHLERNPMAICWSIYKSEFSNPDMAFTYSQEYIAEFYLLYN